MALEIAGRISIKIFFNQKEVPLGYGTGITLTKLHMSCSTRIGVPMIHIVAEDTIDYFQTSKLLFDNCLITVVIAESTGVGRTYEFRLNSYSYPESVVSQSRSISIDGYLNTIKYWQETCFTSFSGTSSSVLSTIANKCGLNYVGESTSDSQIWFPNNLPYFEMARRISERGYKTDSSCMQLGLDLSKTLLYKDVSSLANPKTSIAVGKRVEGKLYAVDVKPISRPGAKNGLTGYSSKVIEQDILDPTYKTKSTVKVSSTNGRGLAMNSKAKAEVQAGKVRFGPIDPGNVHEFYEVALYQNRRLTNLFNNGLELIFSEPTNLVLLDCVSVSSDNENRDLFALRGNYRVSSRNVYTNGADYYEKVELTTTAYGYSNSNLVAGG